MRSALIAGVALSVVVTAWLVDSGRADAAQPPVVTAIIEGRDHDTGAEILTVYGSRLTALKTFHLVRNGPMPVDIGPVTLLVKTKTQLILRLPDAVATDPFPDYALVLGAKTPILTIPLTLTRGGPAAGTVGPSSFSEAAIVSLNSRYIPLADGALTGSLAAVTEQPVALTGTTSTLMGGIGVQGRARVVTSNTHAIPGSVGVSGLGNTGVVGTSDEYTGVGVLAQSYAGLPLRADQLFQGDIAVFRTQGANQARIDAAGKGYFNGGTQTSGADFAERVKVDRPASSFEAGDVIAIDPAGTRRFKLSDEAESALVVGVYSTKPAMLAGLSDAMTDAWKADEVPLGIVGIVPTKVCDEGGAIRPGDLLVAASVAGHAKKASADPKPGTVIGKALAPLAAGRGRIEVFLVAR